MLAGEWAVLEAQKPCLVLAVNKRMTVEIKEDTKTSISSEDFNISCLEITAKNRKAFPEMLFVFEAIEKSLLYLESNQVASKHFSLVIRSGINKDISRANRKSKVGFGSSAAVVVAVVGAVLALHQLKIESFADKVRVFKLASLAHYVAQGQKGSSFDVAASVFGGIVFYQKTDYKKLMTMLEKKGLKKIIDTRWPGLFLESLEIPDSFKLLVAFCGNAAKTSELILRVQVFKKKNPSEYQSIVLAIETVVLKMKEALIQNDLNFLKKLIHKNRQLLKELGEKSGVKLETLALSRIIELANKKGAAAKFSGAGGGDIAIAICSDAAEQKEVKNIWQKNHIQLIPVQIDSDGLLLEKNKKIG